MIRMRIVFVRGDENLGFVCTQHAYKCGSRHFSRPHVPVGLIEIQTDVNLHDPRRVECFFGANLGRAARSHLASRQVANTRAITERLQFEKRSRHRQFRVVWMRKHCQHIKLRLRRTHCRSLA